MDNTDKALAEERIDQAADFAARIYSGSLSAADKQVLDKWLAESAENRDAYRDMLDTWYLTGAAADRLDEVESKAVNGNRVRSSQRWPRWATAAGVVLAVSAGLLALVNSALYKNGDAQQASALASYTTGTGEQKTVELQDGSVVMLNTNTRLLIDYSDTRRRIILQQGEAFFDVQRDPSRPFTVDAGTRAVTALGTSFDVHKAGFQLEVAVVEGVVAIHRAEERVNSGMQMAALVPGRSPAPTAVDRYRLEAGAAAVFPGRSANHHRVTVSALQNTARFPEWRFGAIRFNDQPLYQVVKELNRYTRKKVLIEDSRIIEMKISGVFQLGSIDNALHNLEGALPLQVTQYPDRIVITGRM